MSWDKSEKEKKALFREIALDDNIEFENETLEDDIVVRGIGENRLDVKSARSSHRHYQSTGSTGGSLPKPQNLRPTVSFDGSLRKGRLSQGRPLHQVRDSWEIPEKSTSKSVKPPRTTIQKGKAMPSGRGTKRKREKPIVLLPESRQVLKGLQFFFVREKDLGPRSVQIRKAKEYGAVRHEVWTDDVTHIIADAELSHKEVVDHVQKNIVERIPDKVAIVKYDEFVVDCIKFGYQVDAHRPHYRLHGYKEFVAASTSSGNDLKASGKRAPDEERENLEPHEPTYRHAERSHANIPGPQEIAPESLAMSSLPMSERTFNDELEQVIEEAKAFKDLPLDFDDDDEPNATSSEDSGNESEEEQRPQSRSKSVSFQKSGQANFACMNKSDGSTEARNPNAQIIIVLQEMSDVYSRLNDQWRTLAYRKAISQLKKQTNKITTKEQAQQLPFVGARLALKIQEIATTNRLLRLENAMLEPEEKALQTFLGIYGVGAAQAHKWIEQGHRTLSDLTDQQIPLTPNQKVGIDHYEDFATRITRSEMSAHDSFVRRFVSKIDGALEFTIGGSYRRGEASSGDIDFIVTKAGADAGTIATIMLDRVIPLLTKADYLKVGLSTASHQSNGEAGSKWHGACALPLPKSTVTDSEVEVEGTKRRPWRRIDFLFTPHDSIGAALLYFTGNDIFNRSMRLLASKKGMRLNQRGLYKDVIRGPGRKRLTEGTRVEGFDEAKIFEALGVPWREPGERRC